MRIVLSAEPLVSDATALRPWRDSDVAALVALCGDPEIARFTRVPSPYRETDARLYLLHRYDLLSAGTAAPFAVTAGPGGPVAGSISLMRIDHAQRRAEVGYWLGREHRGDGHATRALSLICAFGFESLALERITLHAAIANHRSRAVAERAGFTAEATLRSYSRGNECRYDMIAFGLLSTDGR